MEVLLTVIWWRLVYLLTTALPLQHYSTAHIHIRTVFNNSCFLKERVRQTIQRSADQTKRWHLTFLSFSGPAEELFWNRNLDGKCQLTFFFGAEDISWLCLCILSPVEHFWTFFSVFSCVFVAVSGAERHQSSVHGAETHGCSYHI